MNGRTRCACHGPTAGPMAVAQRLERVLIGHIAVHQGSIEAAIG